jgi:SAM-dependent methyltransferase
VHDVQRAQSDLKTRADSFGREAQRYDRSRPGYPPALIDDIVGRDPHEVSVLDVGCGTGIASRLLAERGAHVLGVDGNAGMAEIAALHGIPVEVARFEAWDPAERTFDRVASAQAWHWLDPAASTGKAASVLRPGGRLCVFWSAGFHPNDLADALSDTYRSVLPERGPVLVIGYAANRADDTLADSSVVTDAFRACDGLAGPRMRSFTWSRRYSRDQWLDQLLSHSDHLALDPELRQRLSDGIGSTIDGFGGTFTMTYVTTLVSATRR